MATDWLKRRPRAVHMTIRDVDCRHFDVPQFIADMKRCHVSFFSFFAGGYVTTYPTALKYQRMSPYLEGRDLAGEVFEEAHRHGLKALPMIDLSVLPREAVEDHPEWCVAGPDGTPVSSNHGLHRACSLAGYVRDYSREFVREMVERYPADGIKFGGGSFGFGRDVCYCPTCRQRYRQETGRELPAGAEWGDSEWHIYYEWRTDKIVETVAHLNRMVKAFDPKLPVTGNSVAFGDPGWTLNASFDLERIAAEEDAAQVEVQTRLWPSRETVHWQYERWPAETAAYMDSVNDRPFWIVASYFIAWPWRRSAAPYHEQKAYLALGAAHGGGLMVNLSGGPPAVHEDRRGFQAVEEVYGFVERHGEYLDNDDSAAELALVYSRPTLLQQGHKGGGRYVEEIRGFEQALFEAHIPFDIISSRMLADGRVERYRLLVLPETACLSDAEAQALRRFVGRGGSLVASYETGLFDGEGRGRKDFALGDVFGLSHAASQDVEEPGVPTPQQSYMTKSLPHPLTDGLDAELTPAHGRYCRVNVAQGEVLLELSAAFRVFPEGLSYPTDGPRAHPMLVVHQHPSNGRTAYFAGHIGQTYYRCRIPDHGALIARAVEWAVDDDLPLRVVAPSSVHCSLRRKADAWMVHCVNLTGGNRFRRETVPVHGVRIGVRKDDNREPSAFLLDAGKRLSVSEWDGYWWVTVPRIEHWDVVLFRRH